MANATKAQGTLLDWTTLNDLLSLVPGIDSGTLDLGVGVTDAVIHITVAHIDATAAGTAIVTVKVFGLIGTTDEDWQLITQASAGGGTAQKVDVSAQSALGQPNLNVALTAVWGVAGGAGAAIRIFILDATLINSEVVTLIGWATNSYYICADNLVNTHGTTADLLDGVNEIPVNIPNGCRYVKVVFANADDDALYAVQIKYEAVTAYG